MRTEKIAGYTVQLYDSIEDLPIRRFHKFNKYLLVDSGIGSDIEDINAHIHRVSLFMDSDMDSAKRELENLRQSLFMVSEETNLKHLAFVLLIHSIDGKEVTDISEEGAKAIVEKLGSEKRGVISRIFTAIKKKVELELSLYFPGNMEDSTIKEYYDKLKRRTQLILDSITKGVDISKELKEIDAFLLSLVKPKVFTGKESEEILYDKRFEKINMVLRQEVPGLDVGSMSVMEYFTAMEHIKNKARNTRKDGR